MAKIVAVSGYFDPIHPGHLQYFVEAKALGDKLLVIVNNDQQAILKKGKPFMPMWDRIQIIEALKMVDIVVPSIDKDGTVCESLALYRPHVFAKGGDRDKNNTPEFAVCDGLKIEFIDNIGGMKVKSSSGYINAWHKQGIA
jgi:D-beta-D-heptose 7-phosphate kinase/D-beta-D-heptose 1-phosphate adenosyltransferase